MSRPKVSVFVVTFNHSLYIKQCLDSILKQNTTYSYEIIIGEDNSEDDTWNICHEYSLRYPNITLLPNENRLGLNKNWVRTILACKGEYIAMCEGDDYWIDTNKIQLQVDFLERNKQFILSFTNSYIIDDDNSTRMPGKINIWNEANTSEIINHNDFSKDNLVTPGHTSSIVFRNHQITAFPDWFYDVQVTDLPLFIILSSFGMSKFINEFTSVYRIHGNNLSNFKFSFLNLYIERIYIYKNLNRFLNYKFKGQINALISHYYRNCYKIYKSEFKINMAIKSILSAIIYDRFFFIRKFIKR